MITKYKNSYLFISVLIILSLCCMYSLGVFDTHFLKNVTEKNYEAGSFSYTGELLNGKFQHKGTIKLDDGSTYDGIFKNGDFCGGFTYSSDNNNYVVSGAFEKGKIVKADLKIENYKVSTNEDNKIDYENNDGSHYVGQVNAFGQNNKGTFTYSDKSKYVGTFSQGLADKEGVFYSKDGKINYKGNLQNGLFHGFGIYKFGNCEYVGEFKNGLPDGKGTYKSKDGWTYEGNFKNGVFNEDGILIDASGAKSNVFWKDGKRVA